MNTAAGIRILFEIVPDLGYPGAGHHKAPGSDHALFTTANGSQVGFMAETGIVIMKNHHFGTFGKAQALGIRLRVLSVAVESKHNEKKGGSKSDIKKAHHFSSFQGSAAVNKLPGYDCVPV
jgi:hypothetical protein